MKRVFIISLAFIVLCAGCRKKTEYPVVFLKDIPAADSLEGRVIDIPDLCSPSRIYYCDSALFFKDNKSKEAQVYVHNLKTGETNGFVKTGRGPGELLGVFYLAFMNAGKTTLIFDVSLGNIIETATDSLLHKGYFPKKVFTDNPLRQKVICVAGCGDRLLAMGNYEDVRVVEVHRGDSLEAVARYCPDIEGECGEDFMMRSYDGVIKANEDRNACVIACRYADQLEIVDLQAGTPVFVKGPERFEPISKVINRGRGNSIAHSSKEKKGYVDVCCNEDYIYALYSGRETRETNSSYGRTLRVFTWDGRCVEEFVLDRDVIAIDIDWETDTMFAISSMDQIILYSL